MRLSACADSPAPASVSVSVLGAGHAAGDDAADDEHEPQGDRGLGAARRRRPRCAGRRARGRRPAGEGKGDEGTCRHRGSGTARFAGARHRIARRAPPAGAGVIPRMARRPTQSRRRPESSGAPAPTSTIASAGTSVAPGRGDDRLGRRRLVEAVGAAPVGAQEREQPAHALVGVDVVDQRRCRRS